MPIKIQGDLPAKKILETENIFVMDEKRAMSQDIRPLKIIIANLMPLKEDTELQLLRELSNTPLQVDVTFLMMDTHISKTTPASHINKFYSSFSEIKDHKFDGMIITGAPIEHLEFDEVDYWDELKEIMEWSKTHVTSTLHICWGAQAGLYYHYEIKKYQLKQKLSGIYKHKVLHRKTPIVRGFDDVFFAPHSRYTGVKSSEIEANPHLTILAKSKEAGVLLVLADDGKQIFVLGHLEYDRLTLDKEYKRDLAKGLNPQIPVNYYEDDNPANKPELTWRSTSNCLYSNWLNYYVYQATPYELE